ncbi:DPP IV N-terminal domain-containing protein [Sphingobacterium sp. E70]|uniref:DPP IV N-terminal domain-containing protein n=1 Tax=Sphingobacterium sp. E70 TaxID=2853439 RepID=UPI00211BB8C0|nr:DPP IV N-terminal domain-containing protein [Sphingobacterium sp. E70]ULT28487.1 DPP IV N-terminal domain-containing protein [Sphingobacterium sp. E70]
MSANGEKIVFEKGYQLYIYDVNGKKTTQPNIALNRNQVLGKLKEFNISGNISNFDVSPDGKKIAFVSRGELFVSDSEGKFVRQMSGQESASWRSNGLRIAKPYSIAKHSKAIKIGFPALRMEKVK